MFKTLSAATVTLALAATPVLAAPSKPLPVQSCAGAHSQAKHHGAERPCTPVPAPATTTTSPVVAPQPVYSLAVLSIAPSGTGFAVRATDDKAVTYTTVTWRNAAGYAASCLVQTPSSGTRQDGIYACTPVGQSNQPFAGTYKIHAVYVADAEGNRRSYFTTEAAAFGATFTR